MQHNEQMSRNRHFDNRLNDLTNSQLSSVLIHVFQSAMMKPRRVPAQAATVKARSPIVECCDDGNSRYDVHTERNLRRDSNSAIRRKSAATQDGACRLNI